MDWKQAILDGFDMFGPASLFFLSFTEAIIQPVPPDLLYVPLLMTHLGNLSMVLWLWLVVTIASVLGSLVGYLIGEKWGSPLMQKFGQEKSLQKLESLTLKYGSFGIFIAAFSPIPYKVLGWLAGMGQMEKKPFVIAGLFGRGLRFGLEAVLIGIYGQQALDALLWILDHELLLAVVLLGLGMLMWYAWAWWSSLNQGDHQ